MPTGTTTLRPNGQPIFHGFGWSVVGTGAHWIALLTNDGDTTYSKFIKWLSCTSLLIDYDDLLDGENPPPDENVTIDSIKIYSVVRYRSTGFPNSAKFVHGPAGWIGLFIPWSITTNYTLYSNAFTTKDGNPITVSDINSLRIGSNFNSFVSVSEGRVTQQYVEVNWETNSTVHIKGGTVLGGCLVK